MNTNRDFHKKPDGVVINTNKKDYMRARNRNFVRREQDKLIGSRGIVAKLEEEVRELKNIVKILLNSSVKRG